MNVQLKVVTRDNWEDALKLQVKEDQRKFVPAVAVSLAKVYIKPDGDNESTYHSLYTMVTLWLVLLCMLL